MASGVLWNVPCLLNVTWYRRRSSRKSLAMVIATMMPRALVHNVAFSLELRNWVSTRSVALRCPKREVTHGSPSVDRDLHRSPYAQTAEELT